MAVYRPNYRDPKTGKLAQSQLWWYDFTFAGRRIREPSKSHLKTLAKAAEQKRRRELEEGFNGIQDTQAERIRSIKELVSSRVGPELQSRWRTDSMGFHVSLCPFIALLSALGASLACTSRTHTRTAAQPAGADVDNRAVKGATCE